MREHEQRDEEEDHRQGWLQLTQHTAGQVTDRVGLEQAEQDPTGEGERKIFQPADDGGRVTVDDEQGEQGDVEGDERRQKDAGEGGE